MKDERLNQGRSDKQMNESAWIMAMTIYCGLGLAVIIGIIELVSWIGRHLHLLME